PVYFFFQAEDGIRDFHVTGVQTCALPILGRFRYRTRGNATVPVVVRMPNGAGIGAHEHHCDSPEAYFVHAPGLVVVCPSTPTDAKGLLTAALQGEDPVMFLEPKVLYRAGREQVPV